MRPVFVAIVEYGNISSSEIARMLYKLQVEHQIVLPSQMPSNEPSHVILSGGPKHVYETDHDPLPHWINHTKCPVLGICYGMQLIAHSLGGKVGRMKEKEKGLVSVTEIIDQKQITVPRWMNRYDRILISPNNFHITGVTIDNHIAAFTDNNRWWGVQYHPETPDHRDYDVFQRFLSVTT